MGELCCFILFRLLLLLLLQMIFLRALDWGEIRCKWEKEMMDEKCLFFILRVDNRSLNNPKKQEKQAAAERVSALTRRRITISTLLPSRVMNAEGAITN